MSFNPALFRVLRSAVTTVTTPVFTGGDSKKSEKPSNGEACKAVSPLSPPSPPENGKPAKNADAGREADQSEALALARSDYFTHKDTCPICSLSWAATASCEEHGELWLVYHGALVSVHGANLVDGLPELSAEPPASEDAPKGTNGYRTVPTAHIKPQSWIVARDAYHHHWFTCQRCKPTGVCNEGAALREIYNQQNSLTESIT